MAYQDAPNKLSSFDIADIDGRTGSASSLDTGVLRRKYNFGDRVSELAIAQTPFFRFVSKVGKQATDDPSFKFTERRPSFHKRYSYVIGSHSAVSATGNMGDATLAANDVYLFMAGDFKRAGNIQNIQGQSQGKIDIGDEGTCPEHFLPNQMLKVPMSSTAQGGVTGDATAGALVVKVTDYMLYKLDAVDVPVKGYLCAETDANATAASGTGGAGVVGDFLAGALHGDSDAAKWKSCIRIKVEIIKSCITGSSELANYAANVPVFSAYKESISSSLEAMRSYIVGNAQVEGSSLMNKQWNDQPFSTGYGQTQIWRSEFGMTNTARATILKYEANEWARIWRDKLIEHKWDIEHSLLFGSQASIGDYNYTQGAVDYVQSYGNQFDLTLASKTQDDFLDDLSKLIDPRYNQSESTVFFCSTAVYNWLHKLSGYFANNVANMYPGAGVDSTKSLGRADFAITGSSKAFGVDITRISTVYGDMNVARHVMLDGTDVKMIGVNMKHVKYRPLVGNGVNRDTSVYVGVQSLENTGTDKRVDMILTEAGMEFKMPESHAIWK